MFEDLSIVMPGSSLKYKNLAGKLLKCCAGPGFV